MDQSFKTTIIKHLLRSKDVFSFLEVKLWDFVPPHAGKWSDGYEFKQWRNNGLGAFHHGLDIGMKNDYQTVIVSPGAGVVTSALLTGTGYGRLLDVTINGLIQYRIPGKTTGKDFNPHYGLKLRWRFAHLFSTLVSVGKRVNKGQPIAILGGKKGDVGAGNTTGPHVHVETWVRLYKDEEPIGGWFDVGPEPWIEKFRR